MHVDERVASRVEALVRDHAVNEERVQEIVEGRKEQ